MAKARSDFSRKRHSWHNRWWWRKGVPNQCGYLCNQEHPQTINLLLQGSVKAEPVLRNPPNKDTFSPIPQAFQCQCCHADGAHTASCGQMEASMHPVGRWRPQMEVLYLKGKHCSCSGTGKLVRIGLLVFTSIS